MPSRSITWKLVCAMAVAVVVAALAGLALGLWQETRRWGADKRDSLLATASVIAAASGAAVAAGDAEAAHLALRAIGRVPGFTYAGAEGRSGRMLAEHGAAVRLSGDMELTRAAAFSVPALFATRSVQVQVPIVEGGVAVGRLTLVSDTSELYARLREVVVAQLTGAALALAVGLAIVLTLQRAITRPLVALARTMGSVRESHDYSTIATVAGDDEIGVLAASFNSMLSEIRERDGHLARHRERLEHEVAQRTRDLVEAKEIAEAANAAKSDFLATMSHEIRTPMNGMLVMAELLAEGELPSRQRRYAEVIARAGQSLLAIIDDILDSAKVDSGELTLESIPVRLDEVVDTVVTLFGERARGKGLDLAAIVDPATPPLVLGDPVRLTQVVSNLVNNALKFTQSGHVLVRVTTCAPESLRIEVEDTGIGIAEDKIGAIFRPFAQADQATTRRFGGTGLGLSICKRLVAAMGGEIAVTSQAGKGSRFCVTIPCRATQEAGSAGAGPIARARNVTDRVRMSVAGDATRLALRVALEAAGFALCAGEAGGERAHWIVDAHDLARTGERPRGAERVLALAPMGESAGEFVMAQGLADALLRRPLGLREVAAVLRGLASGGALAQVGRAGRDTAGPLPCFTGARVLVADDGAVNREVACEALSRFGIAAQTVGDGRAVLDALETGDYDLVLMDGAMPDLDGFAAAREIRAREAASGRRRMPIVALTAHVVGAASQAWREAGMDGVLHKPFTLEQLSLTLSRHLPRSLAQVPPQEAAGSARPLPREAPSPAGASPDDLILDESMVAQFAAKTASGEDFFARILGLYREHAPDGLDAMAAACAAGDAQALATAAHALRSMSLNVGASRLARRLSAVEQGARMGGRVCAASDLDEIGLLLRETMAALDASARGTAQCGALCPHAALRA